MKSGFVSLVGRPNAGKSTLLNSIIGVKVAITSNKPQTTRNIIQGIYNDDDTQIVFVDTPGIHKPSHKLGDVLNRQAYYSANDVDIILFLVDINEEFGKGDEFVLNKIKDLKKPIFLILNKIDKLTNDQILEKINKYKDIYNFDEIIPVSALKKRNTLELVNTLKKYLTDDIMYYDKNQITNKPLSFTISEIVREKIFELTKEEVPHSITCVLVDMKKDKNAYYLIVDIIVDRDNLKNIIIGKQGNMIKEIGIRSRKELEEMLGKKVYLETYVKTIKNWRDKEKYLADLGFKDFEE